MDVLIDDTEIKPEELKKELMEKEFNNSFDENFDTFII